MVKLEHADEPLLPIKAFVVRVFRFFCLALVVIGVSLSIGVLGSQYLQGLPWPDSLLNAALILTGLGLVDLPKDDVAKYFTTGYALFSGLIYITTAGIIFTPLAHRLLHWFHLEVSGYPAADDGA